MNESILKNAVAIVGITQLLKNIIPIKKGWFWTLVTIIIGAIVSYLSYYFPQTTNVMITISGATIFYDTIYKTLEKMFRPPEEK